MFQDTLSSQPTHFWPRWGSFLFFSFFSSEILYTLLLLNHKTSKSNFCVQLLSCKCNFFSRNFWGNSIGNPPNGASKYQFFERLKLRCYFFFNISRYLTDKYFNVVWGCHPPGDSPNRPPKSTFWMAQARVLLFFDISRYLTDNYFDIVWGCHPPWGPRNGLPKNQIFERLNLECQCFMMSADTKQTIILT